MNLAERMSRLGTETAFEVLARAGQLEAQGRDIIHLEIGQPDFQTPDYIIEAAHQALKDGYTGYGPSAGLPQARERYAQYLNDTRGTDYDASEIVITPGAKPILFFGILALVDEGDEVIVPNPGFPIYESVTEFVGAKAVPAPLREEREFRLDPDELASLVTDKTKLIILNSPHNPTGSMLTMEDLEAIAAIAIEHQIMVLSDEPYSKMVYDGEFHSIAEVDGMRDLTILLEGFSKTYAMTGWRLGYAAMPADLATQIAKLQTNCTSCTASFIQIAGMAAYDGPQEESEAMMDSFKQRRDVIVAGLNELPGVSCLSPAGAFYVFPNVTGTGIDGKQLASDCLEKAGVAVLSGTAFGKYGAGYLRLSSANSLENINEALERIRTLLEG
ncbi:MAG: pyridoxal phosphate-dependent aminotransferase [candidate division WS1 bacterium]|jgi:aspartate/methionine/tyrosine aminotransferase|nr:pyridoxal phosphate-dependent aminotransferase [candidate division WS1 bacterium]